MQQEIKMAEDLVALGFSFSAGNAESEIQKLIEKLDELNAASVKTQGVFDKMFGASFFSRLNSANKMLGKLNAGLIQTRTISQNTLQAISPLAVQISKLSGEQIKPVPQDSLNSIREYSEKLKEAADALSKLNVTQGKINPAPIPEMGREMENAAKKGNTLVDLFKRLSSAGVAGSYFKKSAEAASKFGEELVFINTLEKNFNLEKIRSGILNMSAAYGSSANLASAYYMAVSSGVRESEESTLDFVKTSAKTAALIRSDVPIAVDAMTAAMNAYGMAAKDAGRAGDVLFKIVDYGKANGQQLANSFGQITATAVTAGVSLEELGASIATLTKVIPTRNAITFLNNALSKMIRPTKMSRQAAAELGIEFGLAAIKAKGFGAVMQELFQEGKKNPEALLRLFPDLRGQRGMLHLLGSGWKDYQNALRQFANSRGAVDEAFKIIDNDVYYQINKLPEALTRIKIAAGDLIVQTLTLGGTLTPVIKAFNELGETGQKVLAGISLLVAGYGALKVVQLYKNKNDLVEIRHQQILSALRKKEIVERNAVAAAVIRENQAKTLNNVTSSISTAKSASAPNIFRKLLDSRGFLGGFGRKGLKGLIAWRRLFKQKELINGGLFPSLTSGITLLANGIGKIAALAIKVFSPLNIVIGGSLAAIAGLIDVLSSEGDTWSKKVANSRVVSKIGEKIWDFFTGEISEAEELSRRLDDLARRQEERKKYREWARGLANQYREIMDSVKPAPTGDNFRKELTSEISQARQMINSSEFQAARIKQEEIERLENEMKVIFDIRAAIKAAAEKYQVNLDPSRYRSIGIIEKLAKTEGIPLKERFAYADVVEREREFNKLRLQQEEALKRLKEEGKGTRENVSNMVQKNLPIFRKLAERYQRLNVAFASISNVFEEFKFSKLTEAEQFRATRQNFSASLRRFFKEARNVMPDTEMLKNSIDQTMKLYESALKYVNSRIEKFTRFQTQLENDLYDSQLSSLEGEQKFYVMQKRAEALYGKSGFRWDKYGNYYILQSANADLQKSYEQAYKAAIIEIEIASQRESQARKLADAERQANANTLKLIQSMDKFKTTAITAVNADSLEALQLRSRRFDTLPTYRPMTGAQNAETNARNTLLVAQENLKQLISFYLEKNRVAMQRENERRNSLTQEMDGALSNYENIVKNIKNEQEMLRSTLNSFATQIEEHLGANGAISRIDKNTDTMTRHITNIAIKTY